MAAFTRADALAYMRERWVDTSALQVAIMENAVVLGMLEKNNKMLVGGRYMHIPLIGVGDQGRSADYTKAGTNQVAPNLPGFDVQYVSNYQIIKQTGDLMDDMSGEPNSIVEGLDLQVKNGTMNLRKDLQKGVFGNAGGARGRIGAIGAGVNGANARITLLDITDAKHFEVGVKLNVSANDGTAAAHVLRAGAAITITQIDRMQGFLEFASDITAIITSPAVNDYIFADGDFKLKWSGFGGWLPTAAPGITDSFHGVNRSTNVNVLSGLRYDATGKPVEQAFVAAASYADLYDAHFDLAVINPVRWGSFVNSLGADRANRLTEVKGSAGKVEIAYSAIVIYTNFGPVPVVADAGCGGTEGFGLTKESWVVGHSGDEGELVRIIDDDGNKIRRDSAGGDNWQLDMKVRGNMGCKQPGQNIRLTFSALN